MSYSLPQSVCVMSPSASPWRGAQSLLAALACVVSVLGLARIGEADVRVTSLTPACAARGETVALTGNGLGATNVQITVGGVRAQVTSATGNKATFIVPAGAPLGVATLTATNPGGNSGSTLMRVKGPEVCGNQMDENCNGVLDDPEACSPVNHTPIANAGPGQTVAVGETVHLSGAASSDPDGDALTYQWAFTTRPAGSAAALSTPTAVAPTFVADKAGTYTVQLVVNDGQLTSAPSTTTVSTSNTAPVANAGPDLSAPVGATVTLDGTASSDVDGNPLTYRWSFVSRPVGSAAALVNATTAIASFVPDKPGDYVVQLIVNDGKVNSIPDTVTVGTLNTRPLANAGPDQSARVTETVQLDGSGSSDADGNPLTYEWSLLARPAGSSTVLTDATTVQPSLRIDKAGNYTVQLVVNDGITSSVPDSVTISTVNTAPVANAGPDQGARVGETVQLDGSASSDVDGNPLTYQWSLATRPAGSSATLTNPLTAAPSLRIDKAGTYAAQLIVNDGTLDSAPATVTISTLNTPPVADAGPDQSAHVGDTVQLDGSASSDVDGNPLTYRWALTGPVGSTATLSDPMALMPTFVVDKPGAYTAQLIVNDGKVDSAPATVTISTLNSKPVANGGPDQHAHLGATVRLDGGGSTDADGDALTYQWALTARPAGSAATLATPTAVVSTFVVDKAGTYTVQLIVNDGTADSTPAFVTVSTLNTQPVADAGPDQEAEVGATVNLDGRGSNDADGDPLTYQWALNSKPAESTTTLSGATTALAAFVPDQAGTYVVQLIVSDGKLDSDPDTALVTVTVPAPVNRPPVANAGADQTATVGATVTFNGSGSSDPDGDPITYQWTLSSKPAGSTATLTGATTTAPSFVPDVVGGYTVQLIVHDGKTNSGPDTVQVTAVAANRAPVANAGLDQTVTAGATVMLDGSGSSDPDGNPLTYQWTLSSKPVGSTAALTNATAVNPSFVADKSGAYVLQLTVNDGTINSGADTVTVTAEAAVNLPPDPVTVAPPVDRSVATDIATASAFLYTGANPIQTGVAPGTIEARRASVIRGTVLNTANAPMPGVTITVLNHPEFGQTLSRADGMFDLAVNGGGLLTITYAKVGYFTAQRQVNAPWHDFVRASDVVLVQADPHVSTVDLTSTAPMQVARGSVQSDADGSRQATLLFPQGMHAEMVMPDGTHQPISTLSVRATEFSVGLNGLQRMPAELPPTSGYTYAVVFTADEAKAAGAEDVVFATPIPFYVENFLNFPVGMAAPLGVYDPHTGVWVPADSGRVVKIVSITGGVADLDTDGNGTADNGPALGITAAERQQLASLYQVGQTLWRVLIPHFDKVWDVNWNWVPPPGAKAPTRDPETSELLDDPCEQAGNSIIECQNQVLGEAVGVVGTGFGLHYQSDRAPGRKAADSLDIPLSAAQLPPGVREIELEISVAGRPLRQTFPPAPNQQTTFTWDGTNGYGQTLQGKQPVSVRIGYTYGAVYGTASQFGYRSDSVTGVIARQEVTLSRTWQGQIGAWDARGHGLGGWTLSAHHAYDPGEQVLYRGDGRRESARTFRLPTLSTVAGTGSAGSGCYSGDGGPATQAVVCPQGLAFGPDGSLYIASPSAHRVRRVTPEGILTTVAGTGFSCTSPTGPCGDGGLATQAQLSIPMSVAVGPDGSLYIGEAGRRVVRRVAPDGRITTVAGTGVAGYSGDGGLATAAAISIALSLAVGPDQTLYIADQANRRIRAVDPRGIITTVAGTGVSGFSGDGGPARLAMLNDPRGIALGKDGSLYIADTGAQRVRRVTSDGIIRTIAGNGSIGYSGDGGPATAATFRDPYAVALGDDDTLYIVDQGNSRIRWMRLDGTINTLAAAGVECSSGNGSACEANLEHLETGLAVGPDGNIYVAQTANNVRVLRIAPVVEPSVNGALAVPAGDGSEVYLFTEHGRHLQTRDALTGALRYEFAYDSAGRLAAITDGDGNVTTLERNSAGAPTAIIGLFGQRTTLAVTPEGYLSRITGPAGDVVQMTYTADGLLKSFTKPGGQVSQYTYDMQGLLTRATDPSGAAKTLTRTSTNEGYTVTLTSPLGRATTYRVERLSTGDVRQTTIDPAGVQSQAVLGQNGVQTLTAPDGTTVTVVLGPDPRWGMQAPFASTVTVTTPGGKVQSTTIQRAVTLATPSDPLSLRTSSETVTVNGRVFTTAYDAPSRTFTHTAPTGRQTSAIVDARGRPVQKASGGLAPSSYTYDARGRLATVTQGQGAARRTRTLAYGGDGFLESVTDATDRTLALATDPNGRIIAQTFPAGGLARFAYDTNGNVATFTPPGHPDHTFAYTARDQLAASTAPIGSGENSRTDYSYNADRQPVRVDRPDGQSIGFQYDDAGRLALVDLASGDRSCGYDTAGRPRTVSTPTISLAYAYDGGIPTGTTWSGAVAGNVTRTYDANFRVTSHSVNGSNPVAIQYNADSLPVQVGALTLTRDAQSGLVTATTLGVLSDSLSYDDFGALSSYTASHSGSPVYAAAYTQDLLGRISQKTETLGGTTRVFSYTYDLAGRLSEVRQDDTLVASYTYDTNGNRLSRTAGGETTNATYDAQDRLLQYGVTTYAYNPNGERLSKTVGGQTTTYQYDGLGALTGVTLPGGEQMVYLLDAQNRRVGRSVNSTLVQGFLYQDGLRPIAELDGTGTVISRFVYATGGSVPDYLVKGGVTYRILTDRLGSPRVVVDVATDQITQRMDYDEFGTVIVDTNPGFQPFGFAGGLYDRQTGLVHFGAREYDPETGRWTTKDPIGFAGGDGNLYAYVSHEPINNIDPEGLMCMDSVSCTCMRNPALCAEIGGAAGGAGGGAQLLLQQGEEVAETVAPAAVDAVQTLTCLAGNPVVNPLVYGPSARGALAELAGSIGGETLTNLPKAVELSWTQFSLQTLNTAFTSGRQVVFDLTYMKDIPGVLAGTAYPTAVTSMELRYIQENWSQFKDIVIFLENGAARLPPW